ncbi:MAG: hydrolase [Actinomycetota bacterium]|nr:hydrolase [Actinomycetota bacterium]
MNNFVLGRENTVIVVVDIQDRLAAAMPKRQNVIDNCLHIIELAKMLDIPVLVTEQYPKGLGSTVAEIREVLPAYKPIEKLAFNCCDAPDFSAELRQVCRPKVVIVGMETHICVLQTTLGLIQEGHSAHIVSDAVCSRVDDNRRVGLEFMRDAGAAITCTETVLFQLLGAAGTEEFKAISKRIK